MEKIRDFEVGKSVTATLLIKASEIKRTKPPGNKPYLNIELYDGSDNIFGNHWEWGAAEPPARGSVVDVSAAVTEWAGNKQLNIKSLVVNPNIGPERFVPTGNVDVNEYVTKAVELINSITNPLARELIHNLFKENSGQWKTIPAAKTVHHAFVAGLLKHSVDVALKSRELARLIPICNVDLCIAGGLVHDIGKLWTYKLDGAVIDYTDKGHLLEHIPLGIAHLETYRTGANTRILDLLQHIIASHHGKYEYGSPMTPKFIEAWVVHYADGIDAKAQTIYELNQKAKNGDMLTAKEWTLENRQMITQGYIQEVMNGGIEQSADESAS